MKTKEKDKQVEEKKLKRYWVSWYSGYYEDEGCTKPPFQVWISGQAERRSHLPQKFENFKGDEEDNEKDDCTICAVIDAESEEEIWESVKKHFPDYEERFIKEREPDYVPGDRFPDFENKTIQFAQSLGCEYCDIRTEIISKQGFEIENGEIEYFDHFGNAITNIYRHHGTPLIWKKAKVFLGDRKLSGICDTYAKAPRTLTALFNSASQLEISLPYGSAREKGKLKVGQRIRVRFYS